MPAELFQNSAFSIHNDFACGAIPQLAHFRIRALTHFY